jgi:hypothetical protein
MATVRSPRLRLRRVAAAFAACATGAVLLVGAAGADSTISFSDPLGDGGSSTDITALEISSSPGFPGFSGGVGFWATVKPDSSWCRSEGGDVPLLVSVDTDQNPDTGSAYYGTEIEFAFEPSGQARAGEGIFLRAAGWDFRGSRSRTASAGGAGLTAAATPPAPRRWGSLRPPGSTSSWRRRAPTSTRLRTSARSTTSPCPGRSPRRSALTRERLTSSRTARAPSTAGSPR